MLVLKRVEIQGFKSFCDRTEMRFNGRGVAAVVGPNGCGKSNLSDAISWVLGEQSAKSLRGSRMEDVIFAGTRDRKPVSMAQVTLTLVDPEGRTMIPGTRPEAATAPTNGHQGLAAEATVVEVEGVPNGHSNGHSNGHANGHANGHTNGHPHPSGKAQEITITRRLFRSGDSEYLIDGRHARLRDIQELFMGTGLGPESYAIIEQGRVGQILSSKPLERRAVIEEAAGISKFRSKRRLAEAKLESAKQNLTRVFDILEEVSRQVNSLKRQAGKARRYQELRGELEVQLRLALTGRYLLLDREASKIAIDLSSATTSLQETQAQVESGELSLKQAREAFYQTESELTAARQRLSELQLEAERVRGQMESQGRQIAANEQRSEQAEAESAQLGERLQTLEQERDHLAVSLAELQQQATESRDRLSVKNAERETLEYEVREKEKALETARHQVVRLLGEASTLKNQLAQIEAYLAAMERDTARVQKDEESAGADLERLEVAKKEFQERLSTRQMELESLQDRRKRLDGDLQDRRTAVQELRRDLDSLRSETSRLKARRDSLEEILSHRAYTTESVKRLFTAIEAGQGDGLKPAGVLADFIELTDTRFEKAAEEFLHEELEYVVVKEWDQARRGVELLREDLDGRATFLVEPTVGSGEIAMSAGPSHEPSIGPETGIVGRLCDGLRFTNGLTNAPAALLPRLARCFLAEGRDSAKRLSTQYPDLFFLLEDGVCYHGQAVTGGRRTGTGPLALKRELRESSGLYQQKQTALASSQLRLEQLERELQTLTDEIEQVRGEQQIQEKETLVLDQEMRKISEEYQRAGQKLSVSRMELERLARETARSTEEHEAKAKLAAEREQARVEVEQALEHGRGALDAQKAQLAHLAEEHSILRVELAGFEERRRGVESALERLQRQTSELTMRRQSLTSEMERLGVQRTQLLESNLQLDQRATQVGEESEAARTGVLSLEERETAQRADLSAKEDGLAALRVKAQEHQELRGQIELDLVRKQSDLKHLDETSRRDLSVGVAELAAQREEGAIEPDEMAVADAEERVGEIRQRIESLGPVNPEAWKDFQEAQNRYDFLNTQRQDLLDSIKDTETAIHELDAESRKRFQEAFQVINENFRQMFQTLFGGGTGEMRLVGEGDALDQGIEIVAQPPGKRLQNVLLLSGGEKALTAVALLMGTFKYQPSPFCILDEVDAPLDEANVGRFTQLIKEMAAQTQFIVITHAKKTMEAAESLYGVTMQEQGVSKLVSVRLQAPPPPPPQELQTAAHA